MLLLVFVRLFDVCVERFGENWTFKCVLMVWRVLLRFRFHGGVILEVYLRVSELIGRFYQGFGFMDVGSIKTVKTMAAEEAAAPGK